MQIDTEDLKRNILEKLNAAAAAIPPELYEAFGMLLGYMESQRSGMRLVEETENEDGKVYFRGSQHQVKYSAAVSQD
ncbi:MAG: hypothetical protein ACR2JE_05825 [Acidobacteriaceae bacterium]